MNKFTTVLALAAAIALASPQVMAATPTGHKSVASTPAKRMKKVSRKGKKAQKVGAMKTKRGTQKKVVSHRKAPKQVSRSEQAA